MQINILKAREFTVLHFDLWYDLIRTKGPWDLKNNLRTIYGKANQAPLRSMFYFDCRKMEPQDIGNHHFGAITKAAGMWMSEKFVLRGAGAYQMKRRPDGTSTSRPEWQRKETKYIVGPGGEQLPYQTMAAPYGDDPRDQMWIKEGFKYYVKNFG